MHLALIFSRTDAVRDHTKTISGRYRYKAKLEKDKKNMLAPYRAESLAEA